MSLNDSAKAAVDKKVDLFEHDFWRFAGRSTLAGAFLTLGGAWGMVFGNVVEQHVAGMGSIVFALLFGLGLFSIIILNTDLATGNMMYMTYGSVNKWVGWGKGILLLLVCTIFNLVGALLIAAALGVSAKLGNIDTSHLAFTLAEGKLNKTPGVQFTEAIVANFVVNMAVVGAVLCKEIVSKFFVIVPIIGIFVGLGLEHVIANFGVFGIAAFGLGNLSTDPLTLGPILANWAIVWVGNWVGGGLLIGGVYAWLNRGREKYRD
ncbi:transporter protein [Corynebacterium renale]|uniref:formate/nitrite transporter family protein n=1 Tax=Corynebacterium renale TaxID=1724 RepID=UPI000DA2FBD3|nr:formate/nitrite transporter family protein [Corynebacterium renale]SQG64045.1 transporter protein [Corynebacterium renale]STD03786.1 transporter protein [Corynebacterium renale]